MELIDRFNSLQEAAINEFKKAAKKYRKANEEQWMELEDPIRFLEFNEDDEEEVSAIIAYYVGFSEETSEIVIYDDEDDAESDYVRHTIDLSYAENLRPMIDLTNYINLMCEEL